MQHEYKFKPKSNDNSPAISLDELMSYLVTEFLFRIFPYVNTMVLND